MKRIKVLELTIHRGQLSYSSCCSCRLNIVWYVCWSST